VQLESALKTTTKLENLPDLSQLFEEVFEPSVALPKASPPVQRLPMGPIRKEQVGVPRNDGDPGAQISVSLMRENVSIKKHERVKSQN
jgi:hypothetical protein